MGRKPGEAANIKVNTKAEAAPSDDKQETVDTAPAKEEAKQPETKQEDILEKVKDADLSGFTDLEIEDAMKKAAAAEDYALAVKLRDELKSRKEGN